MLFKRFFMPTELLHEDNCIEKNSDKLSALGSRALIITGRSSAAKNGSLDDVTGALKKHNIGYSIYSEIEENPSVETVMKARDFGLSEKADFVIAIGGGSPIDAAKAVALMMAHPEAGASSLYGGDLSPEALPLAAVPTTCGTGSEATGVAVLTRHDKQTKGSIPYRIFPKVSFIDGKYLIGAPRNMIVNTAVDALAHIVESTFMLKSDAFSGIAAMTGLGLWARSKGVLLGKREANDDDRSNLMMAAAWAGIAIAHTGTSIPHALSYTLTYDLGVPHGKAAGYFLAGFLNEAPDVSEDEEERKRIILKRGGFKDVDDFRGFLKTVLGEVGADKAELEAALERGYDMVKDNPARMECNIFKVDKECLKRILRDWES